MGEEEEDLRKCSFSSDGKNRTIKIKVCTSDTFDPCSFSDPFPVLEEIKKSKTQKGKCDIMILNNWDPDLCGIENVQYYTFIYAGQYQYSKKESVEHDATKPRKKKNNNRRISHSQDRGSYKRSQICMDILKRNLLKIFIPNAPKIA